MFSLAESLERLATLSQTGFHSPLMLNLVAVITEKDVDIIGQVQDSFHNFVETGQVWALIIGIVVGYMFKGFTSY
jgi:hypothetical protein